MRQHRTRGLLLGSSNIRGFDQEMSNMFPFSLCFFKIIFTDTTTVVRWCCVWRCFRLFSELLYNLTADVDKRQKSQPARVYFIHSGSQISQMSQQLSLDINREQCQRYTAYVKVRLHHLGLMAGHVCVGLSMCCSCPQLTAQFFFPWPWALCRVYLFVIWDICLCGLFSLLYLFMLFLFGASESLFCYLKCWQSKKKVQHASRTITYLIVM